MGTGVEMCNQRLHLPWAVKLLLLPPPKGEAGLLLPQGDSAAVNVHTSLLSPHLGSLKTGSFCGFPHYIHGTTNIFQLVFSVKVTPPLRTSKRCAYGPNAPDALTSVQLDVAGFREISSSSMEGYGCSGHSKAPLASCASFKRQGASGSPRAFADGLGKAHRRAPSILPPVGLWAWHSEITNFQAQAALVAYTHMGGLE